MMNLGAQKKVLQGVLRFLKLALVNSPLTLNKLRSYTSLQALTQLSVAHAISLWSTFLSVAHTILCGPLASLWSTHLSVVQSPLCGRHISAWSTLLSVIHAPLSGPLTYMWSTLLSVVHAPLRRPLTYMWSTHLSRNH